MRLTHLVLLLAACAEPAPDTEDTGSEDTRLDPSTWPTTLGPAERPARVTTPTTWDGESAIPVILVLHGYGASGVLQEGYFGLRERVDASGFALVSPDGLLDPGGRRYWNATDACCDFYGSGVDDVAYLTGLLDELAERVPVDTARVAVVGHSNGGFMAYRLACDAGDRFRAVASLAGAGWYNEAACGGTATPDVLQIHGTEDDTIRYEGGDFGGVVRYPGAEASAGLWADRAGCGPRKPSGEADYVATLAGDETEVAPWDCADGRVALWTLRGGSHIPALTVGFKDDLAAWLLAR